MPTVKQAIKAIKERKLKNAKAGDAKPGKPKKKRRVNKKKSLPSSYAPRKGKKKKHYGAPFGKKAKAKKK